MKRTSNKLFLCSLTSLAVLASSSVFAEEMATAPSLEGGFSGMIGGFLFTPSVNDEAYAVNYTVDADNNFLTSDTTNISSDYDTGWQAAIGYVFDGTANGIELSYRGFDGSNDAGPDGAFAFDADIGPLADIHLASDGTIVNQDNRFESWDLMISQFLDIGTHMQVRFLGGLAYLSELEQTTKLSNHFSTIDITAFSGAIDIEGTADVSDTVSSTYDGLGPRVGIDARYDFGEAIAGFGIVGGGSAAYYLGNLDSKNDVHINFIGDDPADSTTAGGHAKDTNDNHAVTNLRANLGIDYVYFFDNDMSTLGLEIGYEVDTYLDGVGDTSVIGGEMNVTDVTFSGPYINIKGVF